MRRRGLLTALTLWTFIILSNCNFGESIKGMMEDHNSKLKTRAIAQEYRGEWDISAKQMATLCAAAKINQEEGIQDVDISDPDPSTYLKEGQCWKNQWIPCENSWGKEDDYMGKNGVLAKRRKPCGYYKMVSATESECESS